MVDSNILEMTLYPTKWTKWIKIQQWYILSLDVFWTFSHSIALDREENFGFELKEVFKEGTGIQRENFWLEQTRYSGREIFCFGQIDFKNLKVINFSSHPWVMGSPYVPMVSKSVHEYSQSRSTQTDSHTMTKEMAFWNFVSSNMSRLQQSLT